MDDSEQNKAQQSAIYGAPLGEILGHCAAVLGLRQQGHASLLGLSAPMLSQLMSGHRIKVANPAAAERLRMLTELVGQVDEGRLSPENVIEKMTAAQEGPPLTRLTTTTGARPASVTQEVQALFRATASAADYLDAATTLRGAHPEIAELLRIYGTERADRAEQHTQRVLRR